MCSLVEVEELVVHVQIILEVVKIAKEWNFVPQIRNNLSGSVDRDVERGAPHQGFH